MRFVAAAVLTLAIAESAAACGGTSGPGGPAPASIAPAATSAAPGPAATAAPNAAANAPAVAEAPGASQDAADANAATTGAGPAADITPTQAGAASLTPAASSPTAAQGSMTVTTKAVELRVEGVTTAQEIGGRQARPGYEFVIVDTSWKNVIPLTAVDKNANSSPVGGLGGFGGSRRPPPDPKDVQMVSTPFVIPMLRKQIWLFTDGRFADTVDLEAQAATPGALPKDGFAIAKLDDVVRGKLVFEAPAGTHYRAFQFYDTGHGHALIPLGGTLPASAPPTIGSVRQNTVLQLVVTEAGFSQAGTPPAGTKYYAVGLRGISRSPKDVIDLPLGDVVFLQNDQGCVSQPVRNAEGLSRPFGDLGSFPPTSPNEGQIMFLVPENTRQARVIVAPKMGGSITLPTGPDFTPSWPAPQTTIDDGSLMKVHILPTPARPASLPAPADGREFVVLDVVVDNLNANQGIEFQGTMQLRLMDPGGGFIQPSPLSGQLTCSLGDMGVIPAGNSRRFRYVYDIPAGMPLKLQYRGFEKNEAVVEIKR
jgi:hypothetical protein